VALLSKSVIPHPPPAVTQLRHSQRLRFITNAAFAGNVTYQNLLDCILVATTTSISYQMFLMVKIRGVELWCNGLTNTSQSLELTFTGNTPGSIGDEKMHSDMSMGVEPAHILARPDKKSQASQFQPSTTNVAWFMDIPAATVVDVLVTYQNNFVGTGNVANTAATGATPGSVNLRGLDGLPSASTKFVPVGSTNVI